MKQREIAAAEEEYQKALLAAWGQERDAILAAQDAIREARKVYLRRIGQIQVGEG